MNKTIYKSPEGYATVMAFYDANLKRWPVPYECSTLPTRYGETHLIASGPPDAPPLVLMRGAGGNTTLWAPDIGYLSRYFRTYALDVIGETGKSAPTRPSYKGSAYGEWLVDVFDALKIERANVAGTSRGGWLTLKIAQYAPERVNRIVPMSAEGIASVSPKFFLRMFRVLLFRNRAAVYNLKRFITPPDLSVNKDLMEERTIVYKHFRQSMNRPPLFTDDELRQISAPTLLLFGEHELVYNINAIIKRVQHLPANFHTEVIPNAGHALDYDQPEIVNARIVKFLRDGG